MFKELKNSIRAFNPCESDLEIISNNFLDHSFIHNGENLFGEMYEAWVYEYLKTWADRCDDVTDFVVKDSKLKTLTKTGLNYDKNGQIIYLKNNKKIAEYDGLFKYRDKIVFVESSVSENRSYFRKLEDRIVEKRILLVKLFNSEEVYYLVVTRPKKKSLTYRSLPHLILYTIKNPEFSELQKKDRVQKSNSDKYIDLNKSISSFSSPFLLS